ncbi:hypothetical protein CK203_084010 [Vitis vinifera]|uniref:Uncharacterized protein n=1 Tax=Vitis vinifera TaxID=29760 RepID=A0A438EUR6_VITVI|nr:hypothetical protein CK203_084010 [Vitis vinifera]
MMRLLHALDGVMSWNGYDDLPVATLLVEFRMPDIERYMGFRCPPLYGIENGIARGLWVDSSLSDLKGKKPGLGPKPSDIGTIGMMGHSQKSNALNGARFRVEMKELEPLEADHTKLKTNFAGCEISLWLRNHKRKVVKWCSSGCEISQPSCTLAKFS